MEKISVKEEMTETGFSKQVKVEEEEEEEENYNLSGIIKRTATGTGMRISFQVKQETGKEEEEKEREVPVLVMPLRQVKPERKIEAVEVKKEPGIIEIREEKEEKCVGRRERVERGVEDGDFPEEEEWYLVGRHVVTAMSTEKGKGKLLDNEIVHFNFPSNHTGFHSQWIVRFSTKRSGGEREIGRLQMEWSKCVIPLVRSNRVKVLGRCVAAPDVLHIGQEILLYVSFYIHHSIFTELDKSTWRVLDAPANIDSTVYRLLTLFRLLKIKPYQEAEFTPAELDSRKRYLKLEVDPEESSALPMVKRRKGCQLEQNRDEQAVSESSLNKLVGAADMYNLEEKEPPSTLTCELRPYQKQALHWMSEAEKGIDVEKAANTLHPCWAAYRICDRRASAIYLNVFSGEATTQFPTATQMARGGILADAMGLGKTVMTIALILARQGKGSSDSEENVYEKGDSSSNSKLKVKGGTLIVCPMALLGQWKEAEGIGQMQAR